MPTVLARIIGIILFVLIGVSGYVLLFLQLEKRHRFKQTKHIRFLQVRIQKKTAAKSVDIEATDHAQQMKNNIEVMNQVYKNFYSVYRHLRSFFEADFSKSFFGDLKYRLFGGDYISMELFIEKEQIKYIVGVPENHLSTVRKMIAAFYPESFIEDVEQPRLLEAGKYMAGGEFNFTENSVYPIKTYEAFEADPMDSILSSYSNVGRDEKMILQILVEPLPSRHLRRMRKKADKIKTGKDFGPLKRMFLKLRKGFSNDETKHEKNQEEKSKHNFSQQ
ncbi:MAG TPA: hypothetical protein PLP73_02270, partial [Candidatus Absconditabacterales bacterium]|nr:hypothetical protein [Candidatus Absconditabacterales bacterium]